MENTEKSKIRTIIRKERKRRGLTQSQVSYSNIENGARNPSVRNALKIAKFYKVDPKKLLD